KDLGQQTSPSYPGVGAHDNHLNQTSTHAAVACSECHHVPDSVDSPGHADDALPADVVLGSLAQQGDRHPVYDPQARTCQNNYCHRDARAVWTQPRSSNEACGTCHGVPPPAPHPQSDKCNGCHGAVIDADRHFIAPERHVDGTVDYQPSDCKVCHGSDKNPAPPLDTLGNSSVSALGVGAHQAHLSGGNNSRALSCNECHVVPDRVEDPTHVDGLPAEVIFSGIADNMSHSPVWHEARATCGGTYCHSPSPGEMRDSPVWTAGKSLACNSCHGLPPALPHPQADNCSSCHGAVVASDNRTIIDKSKHVNGAVDAWVDNTCTNCHGGTNPAPPVDLSGNSETTSSGVGAHQTHVLGTARSRAVPCKECHRVPGNVLASGHIDSARPAELTFSGVALAQGAQPAYVNGTCQSTSCHGAVFSYGDPSGGSNTTPTWTRVDGSEAVCGSCHGLPPPPPHPNSISPCNNCHGDIAADNTFTRPELHVDGIVTLQVQ
ncbi:MAG TPA: CxxxxCH/CxxCH domain-containing protein, partial [Polyangiaceae bacterium]|nr:CxxxxCH/CxxCH domain-containing protein [Polyangiaceae bacterium]